MRIQVKKIVSEKSNIVAFSSDFGETIAFWEGEEPIVNKEYQVEVDIRDTLIWNKDIIKAEVHKYSIQKRGDITYVSGYIESIDDDGYVVLRIGDSIVPFIAIGEPFPIGVYITIKAKEITLFPVEY